MAKVMVSGQRIGSMLANRNKSASEVAAEVKLSVNLDAVVTANTELTFDDLVSLAKHFKRPWSYLLIDEAEVFDTAGQDNRSFGNRLLPPSPELLDEIEAVAEMLVAAGEMFPGTGYELPSTKITTDTSAEVAGEAIRDFLEVTSAQQLHARDDFAALRLWVEALHARGLFVSQRRLRDTTIRAFSRVNGDQAVLVVDTGDSAHARIFSLLHEYCHVVLRSTGVCDLQDQSAVERHCNAVAAAVLMPRSIIAEVRGGRAFEADWIAADTLLQDMSQKLHVSQAALLIRLREIGTINEATYEAMETRRASRRATESKTPGGTFYPSQINRVGRRFAHHVFQVLDDGIIDRQDASTLLEIGEHLVPRYREELEGHGRRIR